MSTFSDPVIAQETRDVFTRLMIKVLDQERPPYQYATVTQIDADLGSCLVRLTGDPNPVRVKFGAMRPARVGQVVRISGSRGDRFISDVIGGTILADQPTNQLSVPTGVHIVSFYEAITVRWNSVIGAAKYEVQIADDTGFTVNVRSFKTISLEVYITNLIAGSTIYAQVRALTSTEGTGPWSLLASGVVDDIPSAPTDGIAPPYSPEPTITPGIGFLLAEWIEVPNLDVVTYEVHISTTSGFTPSSSTKVGEVDGTFYFIRKLPGGTTGGVYQATYTSTYQSGSLPTTLDYNTVYYIRIIAKDDDGAAVAGPQGSGTPIKVESSDVGTIDLDDLTDGVAPNVSPVPVVTNGIGFLYLKWDHIANNDPVTYDIHLSVTSGFTPSSNTLIGSTESNFAFVRKQGPGGTPANGTLVYGTTYYVKLVARDRDGQAPAGGQASGTPVQAIATDIGPNSITTGHILAGSITAESAIIADAAISTAKIVDAAITTAKIGAAQITSALIGDLQVITAKIANLAVVTAKIGDLAVTNAKIADLDAVKITAGFLAAERIQAGSINADKLAANLILVNQIIRSNNFISGSAGWQINGNGSAEFSGVVVRGTVYASAGSFSGNITSSTIDATSTITGAAINGATITGGLVRTASTGQRIEISGSSLRFHSGNAGAVDHGLIEIGSTQLYLRSPTIVDQGAAPFLTMQSDGFYFQNKPIFLQNHVHLTGTLTMNQSVIYLAGYADTGHFLGYNSTYDGPHLKGWNSTFASCAIWDVGVMIGKIDSTVRCVNGDDTAFRPCVASVFLIGSDIRIKRDIEPTSTSECLNKIKAHKPFKYRFMEGWDDDGRRERYGLDANVVPELIQSDLGMDYNDEPIKGIDVGAAVALLWGAVSDLSDEVDHLKDKNGKD